MNPTLILIGLLIFAGGIAGSALPAPGGTEDVTVNAHLSWHGARGTWSIDELAITSAPSKLLNVRAYFSNLMSVTSDSQRVEFRLADAKSVVDVVDDSTGKGVPFLDDEEDVRVVFRGVPPGSYTLTVAVLNAQGTDAVTATTSFQLTGA